MNEIEGAAAAVITRPAVAASTAAATAKPIPRSTASPCPACAGTPRTRDYLARRITEGKTHREAIRCLTRYITRETHQVITAPPETQPSAA
jgi:hypothetical protein